MASGPPLLSIIIINYNSGDHLPACLTSLMESDWPMEIFVVDNASTDGSLAQADEFPVTLLPSPVNQGYAGGVNFALPHTHGKYVMVLNPDMQVAPDCVGPLITFLETEPRAGAVNPLILLRPDGTRINAAGQNIHITGLGFNRLLGRPRQHAGTQPFRVAGIQGGAFIIRKNLLEQMGGWDASGFLYHEDVELSWSLQLMGYDLYCVPQATVIHDYHLTMYPEKLFLLERNRLRLLMTHWQTKTLLWLWPMFLATEMMLWGYCLLRGGHFLKAKAMAYSWVWHNRAALSRRKAFINSLRQQGDEVILRRWQWRYAWDQFITLGKERGESKRQPVGGLPVKVSRVE